MRRISLLGLVLLLLTLSLDAQLIPMSYGTKLGFNLAQHYGTKDQGGDYEIETSMRPGMIAGAWLDMEILPYFKLGYELLYSQKGSREVIRILEMDGEPLPKPAEMNIRYDLDYIEIPILLKLTTLQHKKLSLDSIVGTAMSLKIKGHHDLHGTVYFPENGSYSEFTVNESSNLAEVNMFDYSFVYGTALRYQGKLDLSFELRFTLGWDYLNLPTFSLAEPVALRNQTYSATLGLNF